MSALRLTRSIRWAEPSRATLMLNRALCREHARLVSAKFSRGLSAREHGRLSRIRHRLDRIEAPAVLRMTAAAIVAMEAQP